MWLEAATKFLPDEDSTRPARLRDLRLARWATINLVGSYGRLILGKANADIHPTTSFSTLLWEEPNNALWERDSG